MAREIYFCVKSHGKLELFSGIPSSVFAFKNSAFPWSARMVCPRHISLFLLKEHPFAPFKFQVSPYFCYLCSVTGAAMKNNLEKRHHPHFPLGIGEGFGTGTSVPGGTRAVLGSALSWKCSEGEFLLLEFSGRLGIPSQAFPTSPQGLGFAHSSQPRATEGNPLPRGGEISWFWEQGRENHPLSSAQRGFGSSGLDLGGF